MYPFFSRPSPRPAAAARAAIFAGTLAALGAFVAAAAPAARAAAAAAQTLASSVTCTLSTACLSETNQGAGPGLSGVAKSGSGVSGTSTSGAGVNASSSTGTGLVAASASGIAALAQSRGPTGFEVLNGGSAAGADLYALDATPGGNAIYAVSKRGIAGYFQNTSNAGVANADVALVARAGTSGARVPVFEVADSRNEAVAAFDDSGSLTIAGELFTAGGCNQGCVRTTRVVSYAPRETEPMAEDVGEATLIAGRADVRLERGFANAIDTRRPYVVTLTPEGDSRGLFVTDRTPGGFVVREAQGGRSGISFVYRISAKPYGVADVRLPVTDIAAPARP